MTINTFRSLGAWVSIALVTLGTGSAAASPIISTQEAMRLDHRQMQVAKVQAVLDRADVQQLLVAKGVDAIAARERVAALSEAELAILSARIDELPAGSIGVIEVVGVVAIVLIVLELVGVTDVFTAI